MSKRKTLSNVRSQTLPKSPTGIKGLDEITAGGLPQGRPTLVCGSAGCGKTLLSIEFLIRGIIDHDEPGVFISFEETGEELAHNVSSLGFDLSDLTKKKKLFVDYVHIERSEIEETGEFDLEALFVRLAHAIDSIGAKRVVLDTIEALFAGLPNHGILRAELRRLFRWLKNAGMTTIVTGERGDGSLTRFGIEEYVADCVIVLDHRIVNQVSTRRLRVVKYRGSFHGTNEYPFIIDEHGFSIMPITSLGLQHPASDQRVSSGIPQLDIMLDGEGFYRGSDILLSGVAGTGKTTIASYFAHACCTRGEKCLYFAFEESESQIIRNMRSAGLDLRACVQRGLLRFHTSRPTSFGLETHLSTMQRCIEAFKPEFIVVDPITNFTSVGAELDVRALLTTLIDSLKTKGITALFTSLTDDASALERSEVGVSSIMDAWILLRDIESNGERNRAIYILKSRGMPHSKQVREFIITNNGISLIEPYLGSEGVLMGTARLAQEEHERSSSVKQVQDSIRRKHEIDRKCKLLESQILALQEEIAGQKNDLRLLVSDEEKLGERKLILQHELATRRGASIQTSKNGNHVGRRS